MFGKSPQVATRRVGKNATDDIHCYISLEQQTFGDPAMLMVARREGDLCLQHSAGIVNGNYNVTRAMHFLMALPADDWAAVVGAGAALIPPIQTRGYLQTIMSGEMNVNCLSHLQKSTVQAIRSLYGLLYMDDMDFILYMGVRCGAHVSRVLSHDLNPRDLPNHIFGSVTNAAQMGVLNVVPCHVPTGTKGVTMLQGEFMEDGPRLAPWTGAYNASLRYTNCSVVNRIIGMHLRTPINSVKRDSEGNFLRTANRGVDSRKGEWLECDPAFPQFQQNGLNNLFIHANRPPTHTQIIGNSQIRVGLPAEVQDNLLHTVLTRGTQAGSLPAEGPYLPGAILPDVRSHIYNNLSVVTYDWANDLFLPPSRANALVPGPGEAWANLNLGATGPDKHLSAFVTVVVQDAVATQGADPVRADDMFEDMSSFGGPTSLGQAGGARDMGLNESFAPLRITVASTLGPPMTDRTMAELEGHIIKKDYKSSAAPGTGTDKFAQGSDTVKDTP